MEPPTYNSNRRVEAAVSFEQVCHLELGKWFVRVGVAGCALDA